MNLRPLYKWYLAEKRDLPFRANRDPYAVWVSEVMLQQTRVAAMLPRYREFMKRFPDLKSLANCREEQVLTAWRGLGYYSRARNLRLGAKRIMKEHGGAFPRDPAAALKLEGVGPYTAAAVLSICYDVPEPVLDGNVKRVLARLYDAHMPAEFDEKKQKELCRELMDARGRTEPGVHNQALMELGALVCVPGKPNCGDCPLRKSCAAYAKGGAEYAAALPPKRREEKIDVLYYVYIVTDAKGENIWIAREKESRFLKDLWFFPTRQEVGASASAESRGAKARDENQGMLFAGTSTGASAAKKPTNEKASPAGKKRLETVSRVTPGLDIILNHPGLRERVNYPRRFRHSITHHRIEGIVERIVLKPGRGDLTRKLNRETEGRVEWKRISIKDMEKVVISSLTPKILRVMQSPP